MRLLEQILQVLRAEAVGRKEGSQCPLRQGDAVGGGKRRLGHAKPARLHLRDVPGGRAAGICLAGVDWPKALDSRHQSARLGISWHSVMTPI